MRKNHARLRSIWTDMIRRCHDGSRQDFKWYGAKGISVVDEWRNDFGAFVSWSLANGYAATLTIDRIDVSGPYSPANCRWATIKQQERNRANNRLIMFNGESRCLAEWAEVVGLKPSTLWMRIFGRGWSIESALTIGRKS